MSSITISLQNLRAKEAAKLLGVGLSTFWRWHKERPDFPRGRRLSARCTVFVVSEILKWRDAQGHQEEGATT